MKSQILQLLCVVQAFAGTPEATPTTPLSLAKGIYRLNGTCQTMFHIIDEAKNAREYMGINASNPERPIFFFPRSDGGAWFFYTSGDVKISSDGNTSTYPLSMVMDLKFKLNFPYDAGECVMEARAQQTRITCTMWRDKDRKNVAWQTVFVCYGNWVFSREQ